VKQLKAYKRARKLDDSYDPYKVAYKSLHDAKALIQTLFPFITHKDSDNY